MIDSRVEGLTIAFCASGTLGAGLGSPGAIMVLKPCQLSEAGMEIATQDLLRDKKLAKVTVADA